ncbi:hypothetical protein Q672_17990 [Marinobacter sp. EVN1]|uniref:hypothetical protein n=1 Tax=Marinobacter TaxID=2742 RepID=UPI0003B7E567|nr:MULTISPECIES: hypothetical protein [Marinobacter]ERS84824.1 hypothetical protein Q672_17990 [Marinobacter sp. EVN1]MBW3199592.1 hypothetical protein [Marinobacter nauticus]MBY6185002.1 hypothetical protein [Marinobacter nauticus]
METHNLGSTRQYNQPTWTGAGFVEAPAQELWERLPELLRDIALEEIRSGNKPIGILENQERGIVLLSLAKGPLIPRDTDERVIVHTHHEYGNYCYDGTTATYEDAQSGSFLSFEDPEYEDETF